MAKEKFSIPQLVNNDGCFDLQFRKDTRHERTGSPTYYRWKIQFVVTAPKENIKVLEKTRKALGCGAVSAAKGQARLSVQNIDDIYHIVVPFFSKNALADKKKKDFELWKKAAGIIYQNKGKYLAAWKKNDILSLMQIQKSAAKYKNNPKQPKWVGMIQRFIKTA